MKIIWLVTRYFTLAAFLFTTAILLASCGQSKQIHKSYYSDGKLHQEVEYENNMPHGKLTVYYPSGKIKAIGYFKNGQMDSTITNYYENEKVKSSKYYRNGLIEGPFQNFHENGNQISSGHYHKGLRTGYVYDYFRDEPGKIKQKAYYYNFQGKEAIGYTVAYNRDGSVYETNPGQVLIKFAGDTLKVGQSVDLECRLAEVEQELQAVVLGEYDEQFQLSDPQSLDTTKATDSKKAIIHYTPTKVGLNPIRGAALLRLTSIQNGITRQITVKPIYFEYPLYAN
ncbi:MAG: toxin-antitoxin system YwqK family antitoxin [Bacteroidota bacterium]